VDIPKGSIMKKDSCTKLKA